METPRPEAEKGGGIDFYVIGAEHFQMQQHPKSDERAKDFRAQGTKPIFHQTYKTHSSALYSLELSAFHAWQEMPAEGDTTWNFVGAIVRLLLLCDLVVQVFYDFVSFVVGLQSTSLFAGSRIATPVVRPN